VGCSCDQSGRPYAGWQVFGSVPTGSGCSLRDPGRSARRLTWGPTVTVTCWSAPWSREGLDGPN